MKISPHRPTSSRKRFWLSFTIILAIITLALGSLYLWKKNTPIDSTVNLDPPSKEQIDASKSIKDRFADPTKDNIKPNDQTTDVSSAISIVDAYQDKSLGKIIVKTRLPGTSWKNCQIKFSLKNDTTIVKTVATIYQPEYTICEGFSIERSEFDSPGDWEIDLQAIKLDESASYASANITIE